MADKGYQPDTDDIGSNDDNNSDSHDDLFSASDLSALMIEQDLRRQHAARKLQSHQLKQRQLLMQQHQRIFQDNQQMHSSSTSTSDRTLQTPTTSSHIPGKGHNNNHPEEEDQEDDDEDDEDEEEEEDNTQATPRHSVNTPKREPQHQYNSVRLARYQESDEDNTTNTPAPLNSDKKPKTRGRPKGTTADTTPSKASSSNNRSPDKPKRQYKKTILRQQAALLAAQIKDENEARNTEATRRVLAQTGVIKHLRTLKHRLEFAQYKIDKGLQEQPLHMVVELFEDSIEEDDYYSDDECTDNQAGDHLTGNPNPSVTLLSTPKPQRSSRQSPTVGRTKLSAPPGLAQRDTKAGDILSSVGSWSALGADDSDATDSESESDQGFPETPTKPRGRFAIPRSSADLSTRTPPPRVRPLTGNAVPNQRLPTTATPTPITQSVITPQKEFDASSSDQSDSEGNDESDSLEQHIATLPTPPSTMPITLETLKRQQELQMEEFRRLQEKQLQALMEEQQRALLQAQSQWPLQQKTPSRVTASSLNPTSTPGPKAVVASKHRKATTPKAKENRNPFQEATSDQEQQLRQAQITPISKPLNAKPPLPQGLQHRKPLQASARAMTPDRGPTGSPRLTSAIPSRTVVRVAQDAFVTPQRRPTKSPSPALQRQKTVDLASDTESFHRAKSASPFTPRQLEERERQKERIRENQLREQELIRKQRELEHQQRQQTRRKQLLLQLQYQHLQEQVRLQSSEPGNQKSRPEPSKLAEQPRTADGPSRLLFSPAANSMVTPKKKKPLNPVQKAPSTENILASVRSQQGIRSTIIAASSALTSAKTLLLGNKRVLSTTEDKENAVSSPFSPVARGQSMGGSQNLVANRQLQEKTYKRQRPAGSSPSPIPHPRPVPASSVQWTSSPQSKVTTPLQPVSTPTRKPLKERHVDPLTPATPVKPSSNSLQTPVSIGASSGAMNQTSKEFLNCFDQWMSDLGSEDVQGLPLSDTPATLPDSTLDSVVSPFIMDQSQHQGSLGDVFSSGGGFLGQDDGTGTEPDESEIDQLLYSDFGDDYGVYGGSSVGVGGGQGNIGTPVSETGPVDLTADFMKADFYDWFPDSFREQASSTGPLSAATPPTPNEQRLSLLSTDPILSSSPAELSQGLELDLDFDTAAALSWSQQQSRGLQSPEQNFSQQLLQQSPLRDRSTLSRAGTPQLDSSGSLLSSAFTEILPPVVDVVAAPPANHYVPMGLGGGKGVTATSTAEDEDGVLLGKEHDVLAAHQAVDLAFFLQ